MQSRYYNPEWGRFINVDGIIGVTGELLSHNMFAYCANDPVNLTDSTGFHPKLDQERGILVDGLFKQAPRLARWFKGLTGNRFGFTSGGEISVLDKNKAQGKAFEQQEFPKFNEKTTNAVEQVTIKTTQGTKIRVDAIGLDPLTGEIVINEFKSSAKAPLTPNQKIGFPALQQGGGTVVGKGKGIFIGGYYIPLRTNVKIVRPK